MQNSSIVIQHSCENSIAEKQLNSVIVQLCSSMAVRQNGWEEALGQGGPGVRPGLGLGSSALLWSVPSALSCSALLQQNIFHASAPDRETVFSGEGRAALVCVAQWIECKPKGHQFDS